MALKISHRLCVAALAGLGLAAFCTLASGQTMSANSASLNAGYGRYTGEENQPVNVDMTDANGNLIAVNGMFEASGASIFAGSTARLSADTSLSGAADSFSGAGSSSSASAIGNNLNVVVDGSNNIVIVKSEQSNTGDVTASASTSTNGKN